MTVDIETKKRAITRELDNLTDKVLNGERLVREIRKTASKVNEKLVITRLTPEEAKLYGLGKSNGNGNSISIEDLPSRYKNLFIGIKSKKFRQEYIEEALKNTRVYVNHNGGFRKRPARIEDIL